MVFNGELLGTGLVSEFAVVCLFYLNKPNHSIHIIYLELTLEAGKTTIIIGANGSGKTRLAVFLEEQLKEKAHRIAAHRDLSLNPNVDKIPETKARQYLTYGDSGDSVSISNRKYYR